MSQAFNPAEDKIRIDKWLWAARFYKTRSLAVDAVESGKVTMDGARVKPAKTVGAGDMLVLRLGPHHVEVEVLGISNKRGSAPIAQKLYRETEASRVQREKLAAEIKAQDVSFAFKGRPSKKDRRDISRVRDVW
ncbi:MAG: RNA-binding S4 domain-containing protein [Gallionella sp.]|nr:RNA-binding S4 domain-containing protein [Gallionella sp.]